MNWLKTLLDDICGSSDECHTCETLDLLIGRHLLHNDCSPRRHHPSFRKLDQSARRGCTGCQLLRRALMSATTTLGQGRQLLKLDKYILVRAARVADAGRQTLSCSFGLIVSIDTVPLQASIACLETPAVRYLKLDRTPCASASHHTILQARRWLQTCHLEHAHCANLGWSSRSYPKFLIRILEGKSENESRMLQLVDGQSVQGSKFVALSYIWGDKAVLGDESWKQIRHGKTTFDNLTHRRDGFSAADLPTLMQSAVEITASLGIDYIWIDNVCIGQLLIWEDEAYRMHHVYGNAAVTLCACAAENALDDLRAPREAWLFPAMPVHRGRRYLTECDTPLDHVRLHAPIFERGWTLQEERLSPRILYWCGQRLYWSCVKTQGVELEPMTDLGVRPTKQVLHRPLHHTQARALLSPAQAFLHTCWLDDRKGMHYQWLDLVQAYSRRVMFEPRDKLVGITGLAAVYMDKWVEGHDLHGQEFLAGLWRTTFAQDLAWTVVCAQPSGYGLQDWSPTWSWASLPFRTQIVTRPNRFTTQVSRFELLEGGTMAAPPSSTSSHACVDVLSMIKRGCQCKQVVVRGRLRSLLQPYSIRVPWIDIDPWPRRHPSGRVMNGDGNGYEDTIRDGDTYDFSKHIDANIFARHKGDGRLVAYEARKQPVIGQLDYVTGCVTEETAQQEPEESFGGIPSTAESDRAKGDEKVETTHAISARNPNDRRRSKDEIYCLEIADASMLLLQRTEYEHGMWVYRRVGISHRFRRTFFDGHTITRLVLR